jgi:hypothetical protein
MSKPANLIIRMGANNWDARVRKADGSLVRFDFRKVSKERSAFHRELMNAFRAQRAA